MSKPKKDKVYIPCRDCKEAGNKRQAKFKLRDIKQSVQGPDDQLWINVCGTHLAAAVTETGGTSFVRTLL